MESATHTSPAGGGIADPPAPARRSFRKRLSYFLYLCIMRAELPVFVRIRVRLVDALLGQRHDRLLVFPDVMITNYSGLTLGRNVSINRGCHLSCSGGLSIGDDVAIGHNTSILTTEHGYRDAEIPIKNQPVSFAPVRIGDNVWIGARVVILAGVTIAEGTIVAAGAVVAKDVLEPNTLIGGVPARFIRRRISDGAEAQAVLRSGPNGDS